MIICDASPLIALARIGKLDLLNSLFDSWFVPSTVAKECTQSGKEMSDLLSQIIHSHTLLLKNTEVADALALFVDRGEAESIALALEMGDSLLLIDDRKGRRVATSRGLTIIGTIGLLLLAKRKKMIDEIGPFLQELHNAGIWISPGLFHAAMLKAGENI